MPVAVDVATGVGEGAGGGAAGVPVAVDVATGVGDGAGGGAAGVGEGVGEGCGVGVCVGGIGGGGVAGIPVPWNSAGLTSLISNPAEALFGVEMVATKEDDPMGPTPVYRTATTPRESVTYCGGGSVEVVEDAVTTGGSEMMVSPTTWSATPSPVAASVTITQR